MLLSKRLFIECEFGPGLDPHFLVYVMRWFAERNMFDFSVCELRKQSIKHLPQEDLRRLPIPLPPLDEQRRIVAELDPSSSR